MKKVFITGIAGFIGFHLAKALKARGDVVVGCDNFNEYYPAKFKYDRAEQLQSMGVEVKELDILQFSSLTSFLQKEQFTHIVNLAAQPGVRYSLSDPRSYIKANIEGFLEILEVCRALPEISLVYASSSSVYGENPKIPLAEDDNVLSPASLYAASKLSNEVMAHTYHHLFGVQAIGLRFFTVYGPWGRPDMAFYLFSKAIAEDRPIEVFNHGKMLRDFTYVSDIVDGISGAIDSSVPCEVFNLGNGTFAELGEVITYIEEYLGKKADIIYKPMQAGDVTSTCADITKSHELLGYTPKVSLKEGTRHFLDWMKESGEI